MVVRNRDVHLCAYQMGKDNVGTLAVFGSKRMDYKRIISIVNHTAKLVSKLISENQGV